MRCPSCPWPLGSPCIAETTGHVRFCDLANPCHADFSTAYRDWIAAGGVASTVRSEGTVSRENPAFSYGAETGTAKNPGVFTGADMRTSTASVALLLAVKACPSFERRSDCGCGVNWCRRDERTVPLNDCLACVTAAQAASLPE